MLVLPPRSGELKNYSERRAKAVTMAAVSSRDARAGAETEASVLHRGPDSEEWRPIPRWEGRYSVSSLGRVRNVRTGNLLKPQLRNKKSGHMGNVLRRDGEQYNIWVHRAVLEAFVGPAPEGTLCRHLNGDPSNNRLDNLRWGTPKENSADRIAHGNAPRGEGNARAKLSETDVLTIWSRRPVIRPWPATAVAREFGVTKSAVRSIWDGNSWGWLTRA